MAIHKKYTANGVVTPVNEKFEGQRPSLDLRPAPYLPVVAGVQDKQDYHVIKNGKAVAFDSNGYAIPAGYALDVAAVVGGGSGTIAYDATDVAAGVKGPDGTLVTAGDKVAELMVAAGIGVSPCIGVAPQSYYRNPSDYYRQFGSHDTFFDNKVPTNWRYHNYMMQQSVPLCRNYIYEYPVVVNYDPPLGGIAAFDTGSGMPLEGYWCTFDINSNIVLLPATDTTSQNIGQVLKWDRRFPQGFLEKVRTVYGEGTGGGAGTMFNALDALPGMATGGLPAKITYSGGSAALGLVWVHIQIGPRA